MELKESSLQELENHKRALLNSFKEDCEIENNISSCNKYGEFVQAVLKVYICIYINMHVMNLLMRIQVRVQLHISSRVVILCRYANNYTVYVYKYQNFPLAEQLYLKNCNERNNSESCVNLGILYFSGAAGVPQNKVEGYVYNSYVHMQIRVYIGTCIYQNICLSR